MEKGNRVFNFVGDVFGTIFDVVRGIFDFLFGWIF